ncbi:hypothetical protein [Ornithinibacillus contaminans]|uniref:hypothetical protein n=1 Tax=Ornithinibacillus contaminans TaxID=694055 RepID=UPI00064D9AE1|nr:hypothetical protein [Ornithinibacillus contaminans]
MPNLKYTISFLPNDKELLQFVEKKREHQNFSAYVRELIRSDMKTGGNSEFDRMFEYVIKRIKEDGHIMKGMDPKKVTEIVDEADKEVIMDLF